MSWEKAKFYLIVAAVAGIVIFLFNNVGAVNRALGPVQRAA